MPPKPAIPFQRAPRSSSGRSRIDGLLQSGTDSVGVSDISTSHVSVFVGG